MDRGLIVPLSPNEEKALRRVANGSGDIAFRHAERLMKLALVEDGADGLRLTTIGQRRIAGRRAPGGPWQASAQFDGAQR